MGAVILAFQLARRTGLPARLLAAANAMAIEDRIAGAIVVAAVTPRPFGSGRKHGRGVGLSSGVVKRYVHCRPSPRPLVVERFENSRSIFPLIRPARPIAALVKTKFGPRFAWG